MQQKKQPKSRVKGRPEGATGERRDEALGARGPGTSEKWGREPLTDCCSYFFPYPRTRAHDSGSRVGGCEPLPTSAVTWLCPSTLCIATLTTFWPVLVPVHLETLIHLIFPFYLSRSDIVAGGNVWGLNTSHLKTCSSNNYLYSPLSSFWPLPATTHTTPAPRPSPPRVVIKEGPTPFPGLRTRTGGKGPLKSPRRRTRLWCPFRICNTKGGCERR